MTYRELCERLQRAGIENPAWDAALLIEHFCHADIHALDGDERDYSCPALDEAAERRAAREPLQYLIGEWSFYRQTYEVSPDCLIPRADTEILVEEAIRLLPQGAYFADLCTGSGCIAVSVLCERPDTCASAVDKFPRTLELAMRNAEHNRVRERFRPMLCDLLTDGCIPEQERFDAILSNPPYIRSDELSRLEPELSAEPTAALDGGADGLIFYRTLLRLSKRHLREGGIALFEIGYDQAEDITKLAKEQGFASCRICKDLGGNDRVAILRLS